jgi:Spy/CpxP family protein refolding chaperone
MRIFVDPITRARLATFALLAFVFLSGSITGIAVKEVLAARTDTLAPTRMAERPFPPPGGFWMLGERGQGFLDVLSERLDLTDAQRERILAILIEQRGRVDASLRQIRPHFEAHLGSTRAAIHEVLTPEQRALFQQLELERRDMMLRRSRMSPDSPGIMPFRDFR